MRVKTPRHAAQLIEKVYEGCDYPGLIITGHALNVYQPESWWIDGVPCLECKAREEGE